MERGSPRSVRSTDPLAFVVGVTDDSKHDTMREILGRRSLLSQHACIIHQTASVGPRSKSRWGRLGLTPDNTCKITPSSRHPPNGSNPENAWMKTRYEIEGG